jgi:K+-transporting ATPase ATPase C chain
MTTHILQAVRLTFAFAVLLSGLYTLALLGIARWTPGAGEGPTISLDDQDHYPLVGQAFSSDRYFHGRPSATGYNAASSGGSNKGPTNPAYLQEVEARIDSFLARNPMVDRAHVPSDLVTASGSGIDPHISPEGARLQARRVAAARQLPESTVLDIVEANVEPPLLGLFGPARINVLRLNIALDQLNP